MLEINLNDFPDDVYILLNDSFRADFFKTSWKVNQSYRHLAKKLGVSNTTMLSWRRGKSCSKLKQFCSIGIIKKIFELSKNSEKWKFIYRDIERNIESYRAIHGILKVNNPILPIKDSISLRSVYTHLLCDGTAQNIKSRTCKYDNKIKEAVEEFKDELSCFGNLFKEGISKVWNKERNYFMYKYSFPKAIAKILLNKFKISFDWAHGRIPKEFFKGDRKLRVAIVRAFLIDEGGIIDTEVYFTSGNPNLLKDLLKICNSLEYKCLKIKKTNNVYQLYLSSKSYLKIYTDIINIGKLPIKDKQERLELGHKLINNKFDFSKLNKKILKELSNNPMTLTELSKELIIGRKILWKYMNKLKERNLVESKSKRTGKGGAHIWRLNKH
jgi:hypothetical protein